MLFGGVSPWPLKRTNRSGLSQSRGLISEHQVPQDPAPAPGIGKPHPIGPVSIRAEHCHLFPGEPHTSPSRSREPVPGAGLQDNPRSCPGLMEAWLVVELTWVLGQTRV